MAISFNELPKSKNESNETIVEPGTYVATIKSAEMKQGASGEYCNLCLTLFDKRNKELINVFDIISESPKQLLRYKLQRLLTAIGIADTLINTSFELADIAKILPNKKVIVDIKTEEAKGKYSARSVVDVFKDQIYYSPSETAKLSEIIAPTKGKVENDDFPFELEDNIIQATDAKDVQSY